MKKQNQVIKKQKIIKNRFSNPPFIDNLIRSLFTSKKLTVSKASLGICQLSQHDEDNLCRKVCHTYKVCAWQILWLIDFFFKCVMSLQDMDVQDFSVFREKYLEVNENVGSFYIKSKSKAIFSKLTSQLSDFDPY